MVVLRCYILWLSPSHEEESSAPNALFIPSSTPIADPLQVPHHPPSTCVMGCASQRPRPQEGSHLQPISHKSKAPREAQRNTAETEPCAANMCGPRRSQLLMFSTCRLDTTSRTLGESSGSKVATNMGACNRKLHESSRSYKVCRAGLCGTPHPGRRRPRHRRSPALDEAAKFFQSKALSWRVEIMYFL